MASNFSVRGTFDGSELIQGFKDSKKSLQDMGKQADDTQKKLSEMLQQKNSTSNYRQQLAKIQKELTDLVVNYRLLSDADKQTEFGVTMSKRIDELTQKASMLKDAVLDVQQEISKGASDTAGWDALASAIDITGSSIETFMGITGMSKDSAEALVKVLTQMKTMEAAVNSVIKVGNALQKQSALMVGISTVQKKAAAMAAKMNAVATSTETKATKGATVAQAAFNAVAKANPYVLLATAVVAVGSALYMFAKKQKEATEAEKAHQRALKAVEEETESFNSKVNSTLSETLSKYKQLQLQYNKLKNYHEKTQWINNNKSEFEKLGIAVNGLKSAEDVFINNTGNVVEAFKKRAMAAARQNQLTELYEKLLNEKSRVETATAGKMVKAGDKTPSGVTSARLDSNGRTYNNGTITLGRDGAYHYTEKGAKQHNDQTIALASGEVNRLQAAIDKLANEIAADMPTTYTPTRTGGSSSGGSSTKDTPEVTPDAGSLAAAQKLVSELQTKLNNMSPDNAAFGETLTSLKAAQEEVKRLQELMKDPAPAKTLIEQYDELAHKIQGVKKEFDAGLIDKDAAIKAISEINKSIEALGAKPIEIELEVKEEKVKEQAEEVAKTFEDTINEFGSGISAMSNFVGGIDNVVTSFTKLKDNMDEAENGWEKFMVAFEAGMSVLNAVTTIMETINTLTAAYNAISTIFTANKTAEAAAATADAAAQTTDAAAASANAAAHAGGAVAAGTESVAKIPYVGGFLAIGVAAALIAALVAGLASFANGGIIGGPSKIGDMNIARVNSGEMIINGSQQRRLWNILDGKDGRIGNGGGMSGDVSFRISGDSLVGAIDNYNKKKGRR